MLIALCTAVPLLLAKRRKDSRSTMKLILVMRCLLVDNILASTADKDCSKTTPEASSLLTWRRHVEASDAVGTLSHLKHYCLYLIDFLQKLLYAKACSVMFLYEHATTSVSTSSALSCGNGRIIQLDRTDTATDIGEVPPVLTSRS